MNSKLFKENFWSTEQNDELFVLMPFNHNFDWKLPILEQAAQCAGLTKDRGARRVDSSPVAHEVKTKILDGIFNSKILLFDLSDDSDYGNKINGNVLYELGVASSTRDDFDFVLIREKNEKNESTELPFDIRGSNVNFLYKKDFTKQKLTEIIKASLGLQEWHKSQRVAIAAKSLNINGLKWILEFQEGPFHDEGVSTERKLGILRLLELGIIFLNTDKNGAEAAYYITPFGNAVREYLKIQNLKLAKLYGKMEK